MLFLQCYALVWLALSAYNSWSFVAPERRRKRLEEMGDSSHMYETMMQAISPNVLVGLFAGLEFLVAAFEIAGFALAYAYVPLTEYLAAALYVIFGAYVMQSALELRRLKIINRIFKQGKRPFALLYRYLRLQLEPTPLACFATYGKCLVALQLFLHLLKY